MQHFHLQVNGLKTSLLVFDGSSSNLSALKATRGHVTGTYDMNDGKDPYEVKPYFINQFGPPNKIYLLICPSYQVYYICTLEEIYIFALSLKIW